MVVKIPLRRLSYVHSTFREAGPTTDMTHIATLNRELNAFVGLISFATEHKYPAEVVADLRLLMNAVEARLRQRSDSTLGTTLTNHDV
jgi:hypothetical protein